MIDYQVVPYNVTATRANLDEAYARNVYAMQDKITRAEEKLSAEIGTKALRKGEYVSGRQAGYTRQHSERVETYSSNTQEVFNKRYEDGYQLAGAPKALGASGVISYWIPKEFDYKAACKGFEEEFETNHAAMVANFESNVAQAKEALQSLVTWYGKEHQRVTSKLFYTPEGFK